MKKRILIGIGILIIVIGILVWTLNYLTLLPHKFYTNSDFGIATYYSEIDKDNDGVEDQKDILESARAYLETKPKYKSKYYSEGYPDDEYGVCTDVVAFALLNAGYNIRDLLNQDVLENREKYDIEKVDKNIDFRRVKNMKVYLDNHAISLTTDYQEIAEWQGGDIVVFPTHIGIVSNNRNKKGISYILHNGGQIVYEEDILNRYEIVGHYRIS